MTLLTAARQSRAIVLTTFVGLIACDPAGLERADVAGSYDMVEALGGPLPVRVDTVWDPPATGEWWPHWVTSATLTIGDDGQFTLVRAIVDTSFSGKVGHRVWTATGSYRLDGNEIWFDASWPPGKDSLTLGLVEHGRIAVDMLEPALFEPVPD